MIRHKQKYDAYQMAIGQHPSGTHVAPVLPPPGWAAPWLAGPCFSWCLCSPPLPLFLFPPLVGRPLLFLAPLFLPLSSLLLAEPPLLLSVLLSPPLSSPHLAGKPLLFLAPLFPRLFLWTLLSRHRMLKEVVKQTPETMKEKIKDSADRSMSSYHQRH